MRISGNLIWAAPIRSAARRASGKRGTNSYNSFSASFAVAICARPIADLGRVWADGRLIRDANGNWLTPVTARLYYGEERQQPDPLIVAAQESAPGYRGIAYIVFEEMPLSEYGNRIPNLSFEVIADHEAVDMGDVAQFLASRVGSRLDIVGSFPEIIGMITTSTSSVVDALIPIMRTTGAMISAGTALVGRSSVSRGHNLPLQADAVLTGRKASRERLQRAATGSAPDAIEIGYYDFGRDYQPGLQRARIRAGALVETDALPVALTPDLAKQLIHDRLLDAQAGRQRIVLRLPWRHLGILPGERVEYDGVVWQVREVRFEAFVLAVELVQLPNRLPALFGSDGGKALDHGDRAASPSTIFAIDTPPLPGELPTQPRLWIAAGADDSWRGCSVELSLDGGLSYEPIGTLSAPVIMGTALAPLGPASPASWDRHNSIEIELANESMWLESRPEQSILSGANLAVLGSEIIQFQTAAALGDRRFRISGFLRGRRGTESAIFSHASGDRFLLLNTADMLAVHLPIEHIGSRATIRAAGPGDSGWVTASVTISDLAIQPLQPVHLIARRQNGQIQVKWTPSSRAGFGWPDFGDVPSGENRLAWRVVLRSSTGTVLEADVDRPEFACPALPGPLWFDIAQIGQTHGRVATIIVPE
jgi:hypothetical protein